MTLVGVGVAAGGTAFAGTLGRPLGLGLIVLALLAWPVSMALMLRRGTNRNPAAGHSPAMADCCLPAESEAGSPSDRLTSLRARREVLERELAEMHVPEDRAEGPALQAASDPRAGRVAP